jgi:hypothetical protein
VKGHRIGNEVKGLKWQKGRKREEMARGEGKVMRVGEEKEMILQKR